MTGTVEGTVVDPAGRALSEVLVELASDPADGRVPVAAARTAANGAFKLERIPAGHYHLRARRRSFAVPALPVVVETTGGTVRADLRLAPLVALQGRIEDGHGTPVPLAHVLAFAVAEASAPTFHEGRADARGHFALEDLTAGAYRLLIDAPGLGMASAGPVTAPDADVVVILPGESRSISGLVTRQGRPAHGARVHLGGEAVSEPRMTETDVAGRFAFPGLGPGTYALRAEAGSLVSPVVADVIVGAASQLRQIDLALDTAVFLDGVVVDDRGASLPEAWVRIDLIPATGLWPSVETDGAGRWTSPPLPPGKYQVRARRPGFTARRTAIVDMARAPAPPGGPVKLALLRTGEIVGRVVASDGTPIAGARIHDRPATIEALGVVSAPLPPAATAAALPPGAVPAGEARVVVRQAISGADGRFVLADVPPGRLRLEVLQASTVPFRGSPLVLPPGGKLDLGALNVAKAALVSGQVVDADGAPLSGVRITARPEGGSADPGLYAVTGGDGNFALPLAAGDHTLVASADGRADVEVRVHVATGAAATVTLRFARSGTRALAGLIKDSEGRPLAGARVAAYPRTVAGMPASVGGQGPALGSTVTDPGGHFKLASVPESGLWLEVNQPRYALHRVDVPAASPPASAELVVVVPVAGGITGEVHEAGTGGPVSGFEIEAEGPGGATARYPQARGRADGRTEKKGGPFRFTLGPLTPGTWTLRARAVDHAPVERQVVVPSAGTPGEASVRDLRLELVLATPRTK
ncbi:MAG TPA: carboxypeptidase-like regulatory domain-containing protein [Polyangia bacterium]|jgi:protocatechuate 3,4-dioxygenase beta subunit